MSKKSTGELDNYIGSRVRLRRTHIGMSQEKLGHALGITFQQVQKYEKGKNRISASRLDQIASIFGVEMSFFLPEVEGKGAVVFPAHQDSIELLAAFEKIPSKAMKRAIIDIAQAASEKASV